MLDDFMLWEKRARGYSSSHSVQNLNLHPAGREIRFKNCVKKRPWAFAMSIAAATKASQKFPLCRRW